MSHADFQFDIFWNHRAFISLMVSHIICAVKLNKFSHKRISGSRQLVLLSVKSGKNRYNIGEINHIPRFPKLKICSAAQRADGYFGVTFIENNRCLETRSRLQKKLIPNSK